jgi:uncharacterized protein (DUF433 family)
MTQNLLGLGIYYPAEAARLIRIHPSRLRRWVRGYTYWTHETYRGQAHKRPPVLRHRSGHGDLPVMERRVALSFLELMELRVVAELVDRHNRPLQTVRKLGGIVAAEFGTQYPFASRHWYVEGDRVLASLSRTNADVAVEVHPRKIRQTALTEVFRPRLQDVEFNPETSLIRRWWPLGSSHPIVVDPRINFGSPSIEGTRLLTTVVAGMAEAGTRQETQWAYSLSEAAVGAACDFEAYLAAA